MTSEITHKGRVVEVTPTLTTVEIVSESACSACHAKSLCGLGDSVKKEIQVPTRGWDTYAPGDEVTVVLKASMGHKAVWVAYMIPLVILLSVLLVLSLCGVAELTAGLCAIGAVAAYYILIRIFRSRLRNEYTFNIRR